MDEIEITLRMPRALWEAASRLSARRGVPLEQMMRQTLSAELLRTKGTLEPTPLGHIRSQIVDDFEKAGSWAELQGRLMIKGFALREGQKGLDLRAHPGGQRLCPTAKLGFTLDRLVARFKSPFPGQTQRRMADSLLANKEPDRREHLLAKWQMQTSQATPTVPDGTVRLARHV